MLYYFIYTLIIMLRPMSQQARQISQWIELSYMSTFKKYYNGSLAIFLAKIIKISIIRNHSVFFQDR